MSKNQTSNRPTHHAYVVDGEGENASWTRVGALWPHGKGEGYTLQLVPGIAVSGRVVIRMAKEADNGGQK